MAAEPPMIVPLSLDPASVRRHYGLDPVSRQPVHDDAINALAAALADSQRAAQRLLDARTALLSDPTLTPAARAVKLRDLAMRLGEVYAQTLDRALAANKTTKARLAQETLPPPPLNTLATEIRSRLASLPERARQAAISTAIEERDAIVIGAVLGGPGLLTGLDGRTLGVLQSRWREAAHPEVAERMRRLERAQEDAERGGTALLGFVNKLANDPEAQAAQQAQARTAAAVNAAVGGPQ